MDFLPPIFPSINILHCSARHVAPAQPPNSIVKENKQKAGVLLFEEIFWLHRFSFETIECSFVTLKVEQATSQQTCS